VCVCVWADMHMWEGDWVCVCVCVWVDVVLFFGIPTQQPAK